MSLRTYHKKRDFTKTAEPRGQRTACSPASAALRFVVQKHAATRLHFDLRLELDGVMKSWAVPKGPSYDPGAKRLAVEVEDHPLDYAGFEGAIPKGEYGGGTVMIWDQGTWIPEGDPHQGLQAGKLSFRLRGKRLKGGWKLVRMRPTGSDAKPQWLLVKQDDAHARVGAGEMHSDADRSIVSRRTMKQIAQPEPPTSRKTTKRAKPAAGAAAQPAAHRPGGARRGRAR